MTQTPLSIIIPHWQNASDLERLLASIPTKKGYEIIVVDDYSDDNCFKKVVELHESYNFTLLKNNGKKSAGTCRNIGLSHATGKWILFADADDFFLQPLEKEIESFLNTDYDIIFFPPTSIYKENGKVAQRHLMFDFLINEYLKNPFNKNAIKNLKYSFITPCSKLFKTKMLLENNVKFDEVLAGNDVMFSILASFFAKQIEVSKTRIYSITASNNTLTTTVSLKLTESRIRVNIRANEFFKKNNLKEHCYHFLYILYKNRSLGFLNILKLCKIIHRSGQSVFEGWQTLPKRAYRKIKKILGEKLNHTLPV